MACYPDSPLTNGRDKLLKSNTAVLIILGTNFKKQHGLQTRFIITQISQKKSVRVGRRVSF